MRPLLVDSECENGHDNLDVWLEEGETPPCRECGAKTYRLYGSAVIGDECDVTIKHGLCNEDGTPRRYTSKAEIAAEASRRGLRQHVEHVPSRGSDKNPHTQRFL
jgi:hypothetical protein